MKFPIHKRAYFMRLLTTIICIFTGVAVFGTVFLGIIDYQQKSRELDVLNNSRVSMFRQQTDMQLNTALIQIETLRNDTNFARFAMYGSNEAANALGIYEKIDENQFLFDNLGIEIGVYCKETDFCIMSGSNKPDLDAVKINYDDLSLTRFTMIDNNGIIPMENGEEREGSMFMIMQRYLGRYDLVFMFMINAVNNLSVNTEDNFVLVYENRTAYATLDEALPDGLIEHDLAEERIGRYKVYREQSQAFNSIRYIYCTPRRTGVSALKMTLVFILYMMFGIALALMIVRVLYRPINSTLASISNIEDGEVAEDELEYVTHAFLHMKDDIKCLQQSDIEYRNMRCDEFLHNLLDGVLAENEMREKIDALQMPLLVSAHQLICVDVIGFGSQYRDMDNNMYRIIQKDLADIFLLEAFADSEVYTVFMPDNRIVFIASAENDFRDALERLCAAIEADYEIDIIATTSGKIDSVINTEQKYKEAVSVIDAGLYASDTYVVDACAAGNIAHSKNQGVYYPMEIESKIIENMAGGETDNAVELVKKILETNIENGLLSGEWTQIKFLFTSTINRILSRINKTEDEVFGTDTILYLELSERNEGYKKAKIISVFETLGEYIKTNLGEKNGQLEKITEFIDENLNHDVSLLDLAEYMGLSTSYVSKLFKTLANQNFKTYVNMRRIEMAKQIMLDEEHIKVAEVAARIGCNNTVTFNRMFQKYTGMTPGQFLKK